MDFAAAPIANTPAPSARSDAAAPDDTSSFRNHMEAERAAETRRPSQTERPDAAEASAEDDERTNDQAVAAPIVLTAPVLVQIAATEPSETQAPPTGDAEPAPVAPISGAAPQTQAPAPVQQAKLANGASKDQAKLETPSDSETAEDAPLPQSTSQTAAAEAPAATPSTTPTTATAQQTPAAPLTPPPSAEALAALQVNVQPAAKSQQEQGNSETAPTIEGAADARRDAPSPQQVEPTKAQGKAASAQNNAQTKGAETPFQPVQEAPAPMQTASPLQAPSSHAPTQVLQPSGEQSAARAAPAAAQVGREIIRRFNGHNTQFELRLDPPELGRVDVRLEVSRDHRVTATISADTPQALAEMARHARELEQSLHSAGLELADNGLSFDLRRGSGEDRETAEENGGGQASSALKLEEEMQTIAPRARPVGFERWRGVRVDVMA